MKFFVYALTLNALILSFFHSSALAQTEPKIFRGKIQDTEKKALVSLRQSPDQADRGIFNAAGSRCERTFDKALSFSSLVPAADSLTAFQTIYNRDYASFGLGAINAGSGTINAAGVSVSVTNAYLYSISSTAASVSISGKVLSPRGRVISGALVYLSDGNGNIRTVRTNSFGIYSFEGVDAGQAYTISVIAKQFQFPAQLVTASEDLTDINIIAWE